MSGDIDGMFERPVRVEPLELHPEERLGVVRAIQQTLEMICAEREMSFSVGAIVKVLQDDESKDLEEPRFDMAPPERDARDQFTRGKLEGLRLAHEHLTDPDVLGRLLERTQIEKE